MYTKNISLIDLIHNDSFDAKEYQSHVLDLINITDGQVLEPPRYDEGYAEVQYLVGWPAEVDYRNFKFWMTLYWPKQCNIEIDPEDYWNNELLSTVKKHAAILKQKRNECLEYWLDNDTKKFDKKYFGLTKDDRALDDAKFLLICKQNGIHFKFQPNEHDEGFTLLQLLKRGGVIRKGKPLIETLKDEEKQEKNYQKRYKQWFKDKS